MDNALQINKMMDLCPYSQTYNKKLYSEQKKG